MSFNFGVSSSSGAGGGVGAGDGHAAKKDPAAHRQSIKATTGTDSIQTLKRAQMFAELSKSRRQETFNKRRRGHEAAEGEAGAMGDDKTAAGSSGKPTPPVKMSEQEVAQLIAAVQAAYAPATTVSAADRAKLLLQLRLLLSNDDAPVATVVAGGVVPCLISELSSSSDQPLLLDALWCLTNIASDTTAHTRMVLAAAPALIALLSSKSLRVQEHCVACLANLASEEQEARSVLLDNGILLPLIRLLSQAVPPSPPPIPMPVPAPTDPLLLKLARSVSWCLSNLIKISRSAAKVAAGAGAAPSQTERHLAAFAAAAPTLLPVLFTLLRSADEELAMEVTWNLSAWANHGEAVMNSLANSGLLPAFLSRLYLIRSSAVAQGPPVMVDPRTGVERDPLASALTPIVRLLGNFAHTSDAIVQALMSLQLPAHPVDATAAAAAAASASSSSAAAAPSAALAVPPSAVILVFSTLERSLHSFHRGLRKESCWVVANFAATSLPAVHEALVLTEKGEPSVFLRRLFELICQTQFDIQREAGHAIYNLCRCSDRRFLPVVLPRVPAAPAEAARCPTVILMRIFFDFLRSRDTEAVLVGLRMVELLLGSHPDGKALVENEGGIDALESVQTIENADLVTYAHRIVDGWFGVGLGEEEEEIELARAGEQQAQAQQEEFPPWRLQHQSPQRAQGDQQPHNNQPSPPGPAQPQGGWQF